jgi:hypothetical protein
MIELMKAMRQDVQKIADQLTQDCAVAECAHRAELQAAHDSLTRVRRRSGLVGAAAKRAVAAWMAGDAPPSPTPSTSPGLLLQTVRIADGVEISALMVSSALRGSHDIFAAIGGGELYFIPQWNHFAVRIGSHVLHSGLGKVYWNTSSEEPRERPERVKECKYRECGGGTKCKFFHDPELFSGVAETRNFTADSYTYVPSTSSITRVGSARRIGSATHLECDLQHLSGDDARRFMHQTTHDLLITLVMLHQHRIPTTIASRT